MLLGSLPGRLRDPDVVREGDGRGAAYGRERDEKFPSQPRTVSADRGECEEEREVSEQETGKADKWH